MTERDELRATIEALNATVTRLETTISRLCVVMERQLSSSDQTSERARKALEGLHPDMDRIRARIRKQLADAESPKRKGK